MFRIYHIPLLKLLYFTFETMLNNSKTDRNKSVEYRVKSEHYKINSFYSYSVTENLLR